MNQPSRKAGSPCISRQTTATTTKTTSRRDRSAATYTQYSLTRTHHILSADRLDVRERGSPTPVLGAEIHGGWLRVQQAGGARRAVAHAEFPRHGAAPTVSVMADGAAATPLDEALVRVDAASRQTRNAQTGETFHFAARAAVLPDRRRLRWEPTSSTTTTSSSSSSKSSSSQGSVSSASSALGMRCVEIGPDGETIARLAYMAPHQHADRYDIGLRGDLDAEEGLGVYVLLGFIALRERARKAKSGSRHEVDALSEKEMIADMHVLELLDTVQDAPVTKEIS